MLRGPLGEKDYKPRFSGHETFALRYGWLKKAFDAVSELDNDGVFSDDKTIARFGVGKNMVASIKYWALSTGIIETNAQNQYNTTTIAKMIFADNGLDPYMESPTTLWLIHWFLCGKPERTTWFTAFNHFQNTLFNREELTKTMLRMNAENAWSKVSPNTVKRDVDCFVSTYAARTAKKKQTLEDALESPLTELSLIKGLGKRDGFRFIKGPKSTLGNGVFCYALLDFWKRYSSSSINTLSFESIAYEPGSPGRVFLMEESELAERLRNLPKFTKDAIDWSEVAGLKQVIKRKEFSDKELMDLILSDYTKNEALQ